MLPFLPLHYTRSRPREQPRGAPRRSFHAHKPAAAPLASQPSFPRLPRAKANSPRATPLASGVRATFGYNDRLELQSLAYAKGTTQHLNLAYEYTSATHTGNNGQITRIVDNDGVSPDRTETFTYDAWSRLKTGVSADWNLSWDYDRFGNRKNQNANPGTQILLTIDPNTNRVTQVGSSNTSYDEGGSSARGNLTNDTFYKYTYDAESRLKQVKTQAGSVLATYTYDGAGLRVKKVASSTTTRYIFSGTKVIAEYVNGALDKEYIYAGSQLLATHTGTSGTLTYQLRDHLSTRAFTDAAGNSAGTRGHYPFGEFWYETGSTDKWKFTTYERDNESSLDYAMFRYDSSRLGRFMTPDPIAGSLRNPQSLNRYAYATDQPVNLTDRVGLSPYTFLAYYEGGSCMMDGIDAPCSMAYQAMSSGSAMPCPNNLCSGVAWIRGGWVYVVFTYAGGTWGYFEFTDLMEGIWRVDGLLFTSAGYQNYVRMTRRDQIVLLRQAVVEQIAKEENISLAEADRRVGSPETAKVEGGNARFSYTHDAPAACGGGRCDSGLHFKGGSVDLPPFSSPVIL